MTNQRQPHHPESPVNKPRIFLGSSGQQARLLQAITRGLEDVADVEPWTTTFNPGRSTLDRLVGIVAQADIALRENEKTGKLVEAISEPSDRERR